MCDPMTIATTSLAVGSELAGASAQNKAAAANQRNAMEALASTYREMGFRQAEEMDAAQQQIAEASRQVRRTQGGVRAGAADAGVGGATMDALLATLEVEGSDYISSVRRNELMTVRQLQRQKSGAAIEAQNRINAMPGANPFITGLRMGSHVLGGIDRGISKKPPKEKADGN